MTIFGVFRSVFSPNPGKYEPKELLIGTFHAVKVKGNNMQDLGHFITSFNLYMKQVAFNLMMKKQEI